MKLHTIYLLATVSALTALTGCGKDDTAGHDFENKVFVEASAKPMVTYLKKGAATGMTKTITAGLADPAAQDIDLTYAVAPGLVATYNAAFYDKAEMLPAENYELVTNTAKILTGSVVSSDITVEFKQLDLLDRETAYVLPVTLSQATGIPILERSRTTYYVFRGSSLINTVGNITNNYLDVPWKRASVVNNLSRLTIEMLVNVKRFDRKISTLLGIEDYFLLRLGDSGISANQLQLATTGGNNLPSAPNANLEIPAGKWTHIAVTFDATLDGKVQFYINGVLAHTEALNVSDRINLGVYYTVAQEINNKRGFHIGYSFEAQRYLDGDISEVRIWNRVLSGEEIAEKDHFYYVEPTASGLVTYWKFDDGESRNVKDYTANGNNASGIKDLTWKSVELPAMPK